MRTFAILALLLALTGVAHADDDARLDELEKRAKALEEEAAKLRKEIEALRRKPALPEGVLWQFDLKSDLKGSGAFADLDGDNKPEIVFGTYFGEQHLFCVKAATGEVTWKFKSDAGPLDASVAIYDLDGDGKLEVMSADSSSGHFYNIAPDGTLRWKFKLPNSTDSPVAIADLDRDGTHEFVVGSMWLGDGKGTISCYSAKEQKLLWERKYKGCIQSEPVLTDLNGDKVLDVIITTWRGDHGIHAINGKDGEALWTFTTAGDDKSMGMYHGVALSQDEKTIYMATCQGDVYALDQKGNQVWTKHYDDYLFAPITVGDINADGKDELVFGGRNLYCLAAADGNQLWKVKLQGGLDRGVAFTDADGDGKLDALFHDRCAVVAVRGSDGREVFRFDAGFKGAEWEEISSAPLVGDFDGDGKLECFVVVGVGTSTDNFKGNYGRAMAIKLKGSGPGWSTFRGNHRRTGHAKHADPAAPRKIPIRHR